MPGWILCLQQSVLPGMYSDYDLACPPGTYGDMSQRQCVSTCEEGTYYANVTIPLCMTECPSNYYAFSYDRTCYVGGSCPNTSFFSDDTTGQCVESCPTGYFKDPTNGRCVVHCQSASYFADSINGVCTTDCPDGYFRSTVLRACVTVCSKG